MSDSVRTAVTEVLVPLVGGPVAQICISSAAMKVGKSSEGLTPADLDAVLLEVKTSMSAFTSAGLLDKALEEIRARVTA